MEGIGIGKHLFIIIYILAFVFGVFLLTLNQVYIHKTKDGCYKKLQYFNLAFLFHIVINFVYFYRLYFTLGWQSLVYILIAINVSLAVTIYYGLSVAAEFNGVRIPHFKPLFIFASIQYVVLYSLTSAKYPLFPNEGTIWRETEFFYYAMSVIFLGAVVYGAGYILIISGKKYRQGLILAGAHSFCMLILLMAAFNFWVDYNFKFSYGRTLLWNINIYNVIVIFYVGISALSGLLFYKSGSFNNLVFRPEDPGPETTLAPESPGGPSLTIGAAVKQYGLTPREKDVMELICQGKSAPLISGILMISEHTVKRHTNNIFKKVGVNSRYELISLIKNEK